MDAIQLIAAERKRITDDVAHDAKTTGQLVGTALDQLEEVCDVDSLVRCCGLLAAEIDRLRRAAGVNETSADLTGDYRAHWMTLHADLVAAMARSNPPDGLAALQAVVKRMEAIEFPRSEG